MNDKPAKIEMVTLKQLCAELKVDPREARERLRLAVRDVRKILNSPSPTSLQFFVFAQDPVLGRFQHAIEAPEHDDGQHDEPVLRRPVGTAEAIGDFPNFAGEVAMQPRHSVQNPPPRIPSCLWSKSACFDQAC